MYCTCTLLNSYLFYPSRIFKNEFFYHDIFQKALRNDVKLSEEKKSQPILEEEQYSNLKCASKLFLFYLIKLYRNESLFHRASYKL